MLSEQLDMKGRLTVRKHNGHRQLVEEVVADNDIVLDGRQLVAKLFINQSQAAISHIAVGGGDTAVNPDKDKQLQQEIYRKAIDRAELSQTESPQKAKVLITTELDFHEGNGELREAALFNGPNPDNSVMYNRVVFPVITKTDDFQLTLMWEIIF